MQGYVPCIMIYMIYRTDGIPQTTMSSFFLLLKDNSETFIFLPYYILKQKRHWFGGGQNPDNDRVFFCPQVEICLSALELRINTLLLQWQTLKKISYRLGHPRFLRQNRLCRRHPLNPKRNPVQIRTLKWKTIQILIKR